MWKFPIMLFAALMLMLTLGSVGADENTDLLLVNVSGNQAENIALDVYDPAAGASTPLLANYRANNTAYARPILSADGRLAFSSSFEGHMAAHVLDTYHLDQLVQTVTSVGADDEYPLAWSPDGHKLAYQSIPQQNNATIAVWDGGTSVDVTPQAGTLPIIQYINVLWSPDAHKLAFQSYQNDSSGRMYVWDGSTLSDVTPAEIDERPVYYDSLAWSADGRLAFSMTYSDESVGEIYVWNGQSTVNLSQNTTGSDLQPVWSADGRLAFQSEQNGVESIRVWDGASLPDGSPDSSHVTAVAPQLYMDYFSLPAWTPNGLLAFAASSPDNNNPQIYTWDGQAATDVSLNPDVSNGFPVWGRDGRWAYNGLDAVQQFLFVRGADNQPLLMTKGAFYYKPAWSATGSLAFCRWDVQEWVMSVWDGQQVHEVARGPHVQAQWQSGTSVDCFSG